MKRKNTLTFKEKVMKELKRAGMKHDCDSVLKTLGLYFDSFEKIDLTKEK